MQAGTAKIPVRCELSFSRPTDNTLLVRFSGSWRIQDGLPSAAEVQKQAESSPPVRRITFNTQDVTAWDSGLITFLVKVNDHCARHQVEIDRSGLPNGVRRLLDLATAVPERKGARRTLVQESLLAQIGTMWLGFVRSVPEMLAFLGEAFVTFLNFLRGRARYRGSDLTLIIQECGAQALPIVSLISFLVGLILAFIGAVQLQQFGAQIYVANLVGLGMAREMGAMMTAIIMAGRTGAAFAAQLGTMRVNQEIDALTTMGISPMEFLVLPRMVALMLMMPFLCLYSDLLGILGGMVVGVGMLDLSGVEYFNQTRKALSPIDFLLGLIKSAIYGVLVAVAGCLRGMQCGNSASAVGAATTSAVVTAIVFIIVASAILTVVYNVLGF